MRLKLRSLFGALMCVAALLCVCMPGAAFAASVSCELRVEQIIRAEATGVRQNYSYRLEAVSKDAPLPEGAEGGAYEWTMEGSSQAWITLNVDNTAVKEAEYVMYQLAPTPAEKGYIYDSTVYTVKLLPAPGSRYVLLAYQQDGEKSLSPSWTVSYTATNNDSADNKGTDQPNKRSQTTGKQTRSSLFALPQTGEEVVPLAAVGLLGGCLLVAALYLRRRHG